MHYTVNDQRRATMLERIGEAADLIDNQAYLPFYRSIQIKLEKAGNAEEWGKMIAIAKQKANPARYFSTLCKMIKNGTYNYATKVKKAVKEVTGHAALYLHDKLVRFKFGKYQKYWVQKAHEFTQKNGQAGLTELLELAERKNLPQKYVAAALKNGQTPSNYFKLNYRKAAQ
ncbi:MAG TPA: hypothetical protein PK911_05055 [Candidatus Saccharibacteria bacterium]|nr:hypothetical protein [Candidatus Saccharibacteria bacterium]